MEYDVLLSVISIEKTTVNFFSAVVKTSILFGIVCEKQAHVRAENGYQSWLVMRGTKDSRNISLAVMIGWVCQKGFGGLSVCEIDIAAINVEMTDFLLDQIDVILHQLYKINRALRNDFLKGLLSLY